MSLRWVPPWLRNYRRAQLPGDGVAGLVVTMLLVPQGLAYAALAGLPPQMGLYASLLPLLAYAMFGSSMVLSVGPVAVASLMTAAALAPLAEAGSIEYIAAAATLALLSGLMLLAFGFLRLGALAQFISHPVISGFISGAAILIIIGQIRPLLGIQVAGNTALELAAGLLANLNQYHMLTASLGIGSLLILWLSRQWLAKLMVAAGCANSHAQLTAKLVPMVVVLGSVALVSALNWEQQLAVVGTLPAGLPSLSLPGIEWSWLSKLWLPALIIGLIGFVESVAIAQAYASRMHQKLNADAELRGLGAANIASALSGAFPVTGGFSRTAVNAEAGARSPLAGVIAAALIALVLLTASDLFRALPHSVLAATIIVAAAGLIDLSTLRHTWHYDRAEGLALIGTAAGVVLAGVEAGIAIGIALSLATLVWRASRPHIAVLGRVHGTEHFRNVRHYKVETLPRLLIMRIDENLFFGNAEAVEQRVMKELEQRPRTRDVLLVLSSVSNIDATAQEMLLMLNELLAERDIRLHLSEVKWPVLDRLQHGDLTEKLTGEVHLSTHAAFEKLRADDNPPSAEDSPSSADGTTENMDKS